VTTMSIRVCSWFLVLSCSACTFAEPNSVALIIAYRGPTDKYIPCLVLSNAAHIRSAVSLGEKLDCRAFTALIGTTDDSNFFMQVDEISDLSDRQTVSPPMLFVALDRVGHRKDVELSVTDGLARVRALAKYFPDIRERIETEFVLRLEPPKQ
jgi:hypothetical protein